MEDVTRRIERLEAQVDALTKLLLSHIFASGMADEAVGEETLKQAAMQRDADYEARRFPAGIVLDSYIEQLRELLDLPYFP